jgi:hypothetical protein
VKSLFAILVIGWSIFSAILGIFALPDFRSQFAEQRYYFVYLRDPSKLTGSPDDTRTREVLEEASRRGILKSEFFEKLKKDTAVGGFHVEYTVVPAIFYWLYALAVIGLWGIPVLVLSALRALFFEGSRSEQA